MKTPPTAWCHKCEGILGIVREIGAEPHGLYQRGWGADNRRIIGTAMRAHVKLSCGDVMVIVRGFRDGEVSNLRRSPFRY